MIGSSSLPLFPLKLVLCPGEQLPLHIFEERYKEMIRYCLETGEPFGIVLDREDEGVADVGCTARIDRVLNRYDDGRLDILAVGGRRFRVDDVRRERLYLTATVQPFVEPFEPVQSEMRERAITQHMKLLELAGEKIRPSIYEETPQISFVLAHNAGLTLEQKQTLLEMGSENERIEYLVSHLEDLIPRISHYRDVQGIIRSDGHFGDDLPDLEF
jgi:ATP-dependent Lon protease